MATVLRHEAKRATVAGPLDSGTFQTLPNRRLDHATFQALQALMERGHLRISPKLADAIRQRRNDLGATVDVLTEHFGVNADQMEEIEQGACDISAPTLVRLAQALDVDLVWFIEREPSFFEGISVGPDMGVALIDASESLELITAFAAIKDPITRKAVLQLVRKFATEGGPDDPSGGNKS